jgi:hypothetical protein
MKNIYKIGKELFITNDEKPKAGDWVLGGLGGIDIKKYGRYFADDWKKIILTTDQSLDGVQTIDDDFLEWFTNNPSCERVEVYEVNGKLFAEPIIIPKEEPKYTTSNLDNEKYKDYSVSKEEPKQIKCYCGHTITCDCSPLEETFEEVADEYFKISHSRLVNEQQKEYERELFIAGYKLAQERMYSEEEVFSLMCKAFEAGYKKYDVVEAGLEGLETEIECNWILKK